MLYCLLLLAEAKTKGFMPHQNILNKGMGGGGEENKAELLETPKEYLFQ